MAISTERWIIDAQAPDATTVERAGSVLRSGGLVAFPTETVYGLGANALDATAVARIFAAKGRPARNPLIVHVADVAAARELVAEWPESAERLAAHFWPGPLSLVLPKRSIVPDIVTGGGATVALRVPAHPVALALIRAAGVPVAAPSANRSTRLSPTRAEHVLGSLAGRIDLVLDAGPTAGGLESTVLDLAHPQPRLLRPGLVTASQIVAIIGSIDRVPAVHEGDQPRPSPGLAPKHYAPRAPLECVSAGSAERVAALAASGRTVGWLSLGPALPPAHDRVHVIVMPVEATGYAAEFYAALHYLDDLAVDRIIVTLPPDDEAWTAVHDRLCRASTRMDEC